MQKECELLSENPNAIVVQFTKHRSKRQILGMLKIRCNKKVQVLCCADESVEIQHDDEATKVKKVLMIGSSDA